MSREFKKIIICFMLLIFIIPVSAGCNKKAKDPEDAIDYLKDLDSYSADVDITIINDKQTISYSGKQIYSKKNGYRFEINGERVLLYIGDKVYVKDLISNSRYTADESMNDLYRLTFIRKYIELLYTNEEIKNKMINLQGKNYQIMELEIPGTNRNLNKAELYIDLDNLIPEKLVILDINSKANVTVVYKNFIPNLDVKPELFDVAQMETKNQKQE